MRDLNQGARSSVPACARSGSAPRTFRWSGSPTAVSAVSATPASGRERSRTMLSRLPVGASGHPACRAVDGGGERSAQPDGTITESVTAPSLRTALVRPPLEPGPGIRRRTRRRSTVSRVSCAQRVGEGLDQTDCNATGSTAVHLVFDRHPVAVLRARPPTRRFLLQERRRVRVVDGSTDRRVARSTRRSNSGVRAARSCTLANADRS